MMHAKFNRGLMPLKLYREWKISYVLFLIILISTQFISSVNGGAKLEIHLDEYINSGGKDWNNKCCDFFICTGIGRCDNYFHFCLDTEDGGTSTSHCDYGLWKTNDHFHDENSIVFGSTIHGVSNPIKKSFDSWPGAVRFKTYVGDNDDGHSNHDKVDVFDHIFTVTSPGRKTQPTKSSYTLYGKRSKAKTKLLLEYRVWCDDHYYGPRCDKYCREGAYTHYYCDTRTGDKECHRNYYGSTCNVYCYASPTSHFDCNKNTGTKVCHRGWEGKNCNKRTDDCYSNNCQHGSVCKDGYHSYTCDCQPGYSGRYCEIDIDDCIDVDCINNGRCVDGINKYKCVCEEGYMGTHCEHHICEKASPCLNNGTCYDSGQCQCLPNFSGTTCEIDLCKTVDCGENGICVAGQCICDPGFAGGSCEIDICSKPVCQHGGSCQLGKCICKPGFAGETCREDIDECQTNPCHHGDCIDLVNGYNCICHEYFMGDNCDIPVPTTTTTVPSSQPTLKSKTKTDVDNQSGNTGAQEDKLVSNAAKKNGWKWEPLAAILILIAVAVPVGIIYFLWRRRRQNKSRSTTDEVPSNFDNPLYVMENEHNTSTNSDTQPVTYSGATGVSFSTTEKKVPFPDDIYCVPSPTCASCAGEPPPRYTAEENDYKSPRQLGLPSLQPPPYTEKAEACSNPMYMMNENDDITFMKSNPSKIESENPYDEIVGSPTDVSLEDSSGVARSPGVQFVNPTFGNDPNIGMLSLSNPNLVEENPTENPYEELDRFRSQHLDCENKTESEGNNLDNPSIPSTVQDNHVYKLEGPYVVPREAEAPMPNSSTEVQYAIPQTKSKSYNPENNEAGSSQDEHRKAEALYSLPMSFKRKQRNLTRDELEKENNEESPYVNANDLQ